MDQSGCGKPARMWPALGALGLALALGGTGASAQAGRGWVDPPADLKPPQTTAPSNAPAEPVTNPPAPKAEAPAPAKAADNDKPAPKPDEKPAVAEKPAPEKPAVAEKPAPKRAVVADRPERPKPAVRAAARPAEAKKTVARSERSSRRSVASRTAPREAEVADTSGLQVMRLRTIEYPDGRRVQILTEIERDDGIGWPFR